MVLDAEEQSRASEACGPPWRFSTVINFILPAAMVALSTALSVPLALEDLSKSGRFSGGFYLFVGSIVTLAAIGILGIARHKYGRGSLSEIGLEFRPWFGRIYTVRWDDVEAILWRRGWLMLRIGRSSHQLFWGQFPRAERDAAREWLRNRLQPAFDLSDTVPPPRQGSPRALLIAMVIGCAPVLLAWQQMLNHPDAMRFWILVFAAPLFLCPFAVAVLVYRDRNRVSVWRLRRSESPDDQPRQPSQDAISVLR